MRTLLIISLYLYLTSSVGCIRVNITELGTVEGTTTKSAWTKRTIYQFLGIRFGLAPSGNLRFMPPEPVISWDGVYDATKDGIECPQSNNLNDILAAPLDQDMEDCLFLNIFTPKISDNRNRSELFPVMIYIHGGGFYEGGAKRFPPNYLLENDVVLVVIQYRLGVLGFTSLDTEGIPGNAGFLDQLLGFRWVNKHIHHFNGDNSRVTVFGQSAGACSISLHLLSPIVEPHLFQKAIIQSGSSYVYWAIDSNPSEHAKSLYTNLTNSTKIDNISEIEAVLKNASVPDLIRAQKIVGVYRAVIQKVGKQKFLTEEPKSSLLNGHFRTLPMMIGVTKNDGSFLITGVYDKLEMANLLNNDFIRHNLTNDILERTGLYDGSNILVDLFNDIYFKKLFSTKNNLTFSDVAPGFIDIAGTAILKSQTFKQARINSVHENLTYVYTFDYKGEHTRFGYGVDTSKYPFEGGVHHSDDLLYLFPYPYKTPLNEEDTKMAKLMTDLWTNFAINSKPTSSRLNIDWPILKNGENGPYIHINSTSYLGEDFVNREYKIASIEAGLVSES